VILCFEIISMRVCDDTRILYNISGMKVAFAFQLSCVWTSWMDMIAAGVLVWSVMWKSWRHDAVPADRGQDTLILIIHFLC